MPKREPNEYDAVPCPCCDGTGEVVFGSMNADGSDPYCDVDVCSRCGGDGVISTRTYRWWEEDAGDEF